MAAIGLAVLPGNHADDLLATKLGAEGAAHAAIGAGRDHRAFRSAQLDDGLLGQGGRRAGLHAGAAGDAFGTQEVVAGQPGRDLGGKTAPVDRQGERALDLVAGSHAARTDDAFGRVELEIGVGAVLVLFEMIGALITVAHIAKTHCARLVLQLAIAVCSAGEAVERVIGDIEFHHALADALEPVGLGVHNHAGLDRRGAGGGRAAATLDLDEAKPAGAPAFHHVRCAKLRYVPAILRGGAHDRGAGRDTDRPAVDRQLDRLVRARGRRSIVGLAFIAHRAHSRLAVQSIMLRPPPPGPGNPPGSI